MHKTKRGALAPRFCIRGPKPDARHFRPAAVLCYDRIAPDASGIRHEASVPRSDQLPKTNPSAPASMRMGASRSTSPARMRFERSLTM